MLRLSMPALLLALAGCATKPPANPDNLCEIFREKPKWHEAALKMQQRWGAPVQVPMAMMYQESSFKHDALPPRYYFLGFIPWGRVSSAYGYAQAKDETWADYKREAGGWGMALILLFHLSRGNRLIQLAGLAVFCVASVGGVSIELYALVSLAFIWLYDGRRGYCSRPIQWLCYAFYPVHLLLLWLCARTVGGIWYLT